MLLDEFKQLLIVNLGSRSEGDRPHLLKVIIVFVGHDNNAGTSDRFLIHRVVGPTRVSSSSRFKQVMAQQVGQRGVVNALDICSEILELGDTRSVNGRFLHVRSSKRNKLIDPFVPTLEE